MKLPIQAYEGDTAVINVTAPTWFKYCEFQILKDPLHVHKLGRDRALQCVLLQDARFVKPTLLNIELLIVCLAFS